MAAWHESFWIDGKWKYISENGISSLPGKRLCPKVARTLPKTGLKTINERCCHGKQPPTEQHNVITASQNVASLHAVQLCYSVGSSLCNVVNGTRKAVHGNVVQRCGICSTLPNVIQRCAMLSHRCQTLSNVVTKLCVVVSKLCNVSSCTTLPLSNAVQRCYNVAERYTTLCNVVATLPNVIQRCATF